MEELALEASGMGLSLFLLLLLFALWLFPTSEQRMA